MTRSIVGELCQAEAVVLSAWFTDPKFAAAWRPDPQTFTVATHKALAEVFAARGAGLSDTQLVLELKRRDHLKRFDRGAEGVTDALYGVPAAGDPWQALERLRELRALSELHRGLSGALSVFEGGGGTVEVQNALSEAIRGAAAARGASVLSLQGLLARALEHATKPKQAVGCSVGNDDLNKSTGGIRKGQVWVFGADTSFGKSSWGLMVSDVNLRVNRRVLVVTAEDDPDLYGRRLLARRSGVRFSLVRDGKLGSDSEALGAARRAVSAAPPVPFMIDGRNRTAEALASEIRSVVNGEGIELVMVDYLQCLSCQKDHKGERRNEVAYIARTFTDAIKTSGAGGVLFSQITVDPKKKHPDKHSIRESRDVSNAAEVVLLGYEEKQHNVAPRKMLFLDKCKDGPKGYHVEMRWNKDWAGFEADEDSIMRRYADELNHGYDDGFIDGDSL